MMMNQIRNICLRQFPKIIDQIKVMEKAHHGLLFDFSQKKQFGESKYSYVGENLCGEACFIGKNLLEEQLPQSHQIQVMYNTRRYNREIDDHCFILINNNIIVDLTYR